MRIKLLLFAFALSVLCVSCSKEQKIDKLIDQVEKLVNNEDAYNREDRLDKISMKIEKYEESDFTMSQLRRLQEVSLKYNNF